MRFKYALHEQSKNKAMTGLIFFQTVIVLIVMVSIISAIVSRYERYKPLEKFFQGDGLNMHMWNMLGRNGDRYLPFTESSDLESYLKNAHVVATYSVDMPFDIDQKKEELGTWSPVVAYDDELLSAYTPDMENGRWLEPGDGDTDVIEIVLAQKGKEYNVGDTIALTTSDRLEESEGYKLARPVKAKVVGILADGASTIKRDIHWGQYVDFRDYYQSFDRNDKEERARVFVSKRDIEHSNKLNEKCGNHFDKDLSDDKMIWSYVIEGPCFVRYKEGITKEEKDYNAKFLAINGMYECRHTSAEMRENSAKYIMNQMNMLIPILIALVILTLMSMISNTVIMIWQNLRNYSIYYMTGLTWRECVLIHVRNIVFMQSGTFVFTVLCIYLCEKLGVLEQTVFFIGRWQLLGCAGVILLFVLLSAALSFLMIGKKSAKDILREVE